MFHREVWVTTPKQYPHYIEISLSKIYNEYFEIHIYHTIFFMIPYESFPHQHMWIHILNCMSQIAMIKMWQ